MTGQPISINTGLPTPPDSWLTAQQAATALGCGRDTVRRRIEAGKLTGKLCATANGPAWFVDPACKPALWLAAGHADPLPVALTGDALLGLSVAKRTELLRKQAICKDFEATLCDRPNNYTITKWMELFVARFKAENHGEKLSVMSLRRWRKALAAGGLAALADNRGRHVTNEPDPRLWRMFKGLYLSGSRLSVRQCYDLVGAEARSQQLPWPSLRTVQRWTNDKLAPILRAAGREPKKFEDRFLPYISRDWSKIFAMDCWISDNRRLDLFCRVSVKGRGGRHEWEKIRPWIQVWIDARSWFPVAWSVSIKEPDAIRTAELFAAGVSLHGAPRQIMLDNGSGFRADVFSGGRPNKRKDDDAAEVNPLVAELGVEMVRFAQAYNHKAKPIEPWFKFVSTEFDKTFAAYVGNSISHRPGEVDRIPLDQLLTLAQVRELFGQWLAGTFCRQASPAKAANGLSPLKAFAQLRDPEAAYARPTDEVLCLLCRPSRPVRVDQNGIYVTEFGRWYWHKRLVERIGSGRDTKRKVSYRYLPGRPEKIYVFDEKGAYYCTAEAYDGGDIHPLADPKKNAADTEALAGVMELRGAMVRHYTRVVKSSKAFAENTMLAAQRRALKAEGLLDEQTDPQPMPQNIRLRPELAAAASEMAVEKSDESREKARDEAAKKRIKLSEFFDNASPATDAGDNPQRSASSPLDMLDGHDDREHPSGQEHNPWDMID